VLGVVAAGSGCGVVVPCCSGGGTRSAPGAAGVGSRSASSPDREDVGGSPGPGLTQVQADGAVLRSDASTGPGAHSCTSPAGHVT
jgi:hypothetical protein